jgi:hypothetical protein
MTRSATWPSVGVHTVAELRRKHRRLDRSRQAVAAILTAMQRGQSLNLSLERGQRRWRLSGGSSVPNEVAKLVVADPRVLAVGDTLFKDLPSQTWRWTDGQ